MGVFTREPREELPPGLTRAEALPVNAPRPITAAAARIRVTDKGELEQLKKRKGTSEWQKEAWEYFDAVGEIKYAFMLTGAVTSRIKLYAAISSKPSDPPSPAEDISAVEPEMQDAAQSAVNHLERLSSCFGGIPGMLREISINLSVPGECYLVQQLADPVTGAPEQWNIRSTDEVSIDGSGNIQIQTSRAMGQQGQVVMPSSAFVGRIWRPHPRYHDEADSSMRALLGLCLAEGTAVYTPRGPRPIEDIAAGDEVLAMQDGRLVRATVSDAAKTGTRTATIVVTTSQGHVITGTADHRVQVLQYDNPGKGRRRTYELAYKRLGDLTFDDFVVATNGTDGLTDSVDPMPYSEAWLAGVYIGDGTYPKQGARVQICWPDPLLASDVDRHAREIWGLGTTSKGVDLSLPKGSRAWIRELGLQGKSHERRIPERIWEGGPKVIG